MHDLQITEGGHGQVVPEGVTCRVNQLLRGDGISGAKVVLQAVFQGVNEV